MDSPRGITSRIPSLTRPRTVIFAVALALTAGLAAIAPTSAHASSVGTTKPAHSFWFIMKSGETFAQAVGRAAQRSPAQVATTLRRMLQREEAGQRVDIPETRNGVIATVRASRSDLTGALAAAKKTGTVDAEPASAPQAAWPVRGGACYADHSWCDLVEALAGGTCSSSCIVTDEVNANLTIDPSVYGKNRVTWTALYSPDSGNFAGYHFQWFVLKFAAENQCGTGNSSSYNYSFSDVFITKCDINLYDSRNTTAIGLWAYFTPYGAYIGPDGAKDGTALCPTESKAATDPNCLY